MKNFTDFVYSKLNRGLTAEKLFANNNLLHAVLGLVGETQESLDARYTDKITSELGDVTFYLAMLKRELGLEEYEVRIEDALICACPLELLLLQAIDLAECIKKYVFQERIDLLEKIKERVNYFEAGLLKVCDELDISIQDCRNACVEKLSKRYPVEFSPQLSKNREV